MRGMKGLFCQFHVPLTALASRPASDDMTIRVWDAL